MDGCDLCCGIRGRGIHYDAMTILAHAVLGAGVHGIVGSVMYWPRRTRLYLALSGAILGAGPDIMGWVGNLMGDQWTAYLPGHSGELST